jgi:hypothetical protein
MPIHYKQEMVDRLTLEAFGVLADMSKQHAALDGKLSNWLEQVIAAAEVSDNIARAIAANIIMQAYADEMLSQTDFSVDNMERRVHQGIQHMVNE